MTTGMTALSQLGWRTAFDFGVLAVTLYLVLIWANEARALRIVLGIASASLHSAALFARSSGLMITGAIMEGAAIVLVLVLLILFQPELRRALLRIESTLHLRAERQSASKPAREVIGAAVFSMSASHTGALIVLRGQDSIHELVESGVNVDADITTEIIEAIFQKWSPMHDGAILVEENRITRARVVLPLTHRTDVSKTFGTRHRAAMGIAERTDASVIVVSEEDGEVRLVRRRELKTLGSPAEFVQALGPKHSKAHSTMDLRSPSPPHVPPSAESDRRGNCRDALDPFFPAARHREDVTCARGVQESAFGHGSRGDVARDASGRNARPALDHGLH